MEKYTIFANGEVPEGTIIVSPDETVIAADGGARHCLNNKINPEIVIGDFDSLHPDEITALVSQGAKLHPLSPEKDETDLELAINLAQELGAEQIICYGLLGGRWDMTLANLLLLGAERYADLDFRVLHGNTEAYILRGGDTLEIDGFPGMTISAIPLNDRVTGLSYQGLHWPLDNAELAFGSPRGVSNVLSEHKATISLNKGLLILFIDRTIQD